MLNGIYHLRFTSSLSNYGEGIAVVSGNSFNGGNGGFIFTGTQAVNGNKFECTLSIKQWNEEVVSIFGPIKAFTLILTGANTPDGGFVAMGHLTGHAESKITIEARYLSPIA